jgi:dipeptidase E
MGLDIRLVFYSGGQETGNKILHEKLAHLAGHRARSFTYIPFSHENGEFYFNRIKQRYKKFGFRKFRYFAPDSDFLVREMNAALKSDVIYLAGGNTYYFLKHLRESGFLKRLKSFVKRGGVLAGLSAGAIIMTSDIRLAGYPLHMADDNEVKLKNLRSLGLVDFEFLPHYNNSKITSDAMIRYSKRTKRPVYACPDGSGIIVEGKAVHFFGETYLFYQGRKLRLA